MNSVTRLDQRVLRGDLIKEEKYEVRPEE
jgi:hypothetical protein